LRIASSLSSASVTMFSFSFVSPFCNAFRSVCGLRHYPNLPVM